MTELNLWLHQLLHLLLPNSCLWCQLPVQQAKQQLCDYCIAALPGLSLANHQHNALLLPAVWRGLTPVKFDLLHSLSWYQLPWSHWIRQWKFQQDFACGELLCQQLAKACRLYTSSGGTKPDAVCFVPMSRERRKERGFNQAQQLAAVIADSWQIPLLDIFHSKSTQHQVGLTRQQRRANLRRQFRLQQREKLPPHLLLVDDVITTGATIDQLCRLLRKQQVLRIDVWTLAITPADMTAHHTLPHEQRVCHEPD
ncbi:ComF family protein [Rheinheimera riviphila]|uniref:ComF family protein n=1 Tax=Rheinheimera riviphila TaxID=1834037 RepID=A0A437QZE5_9GAMM|nr:ComF family protein [Rheinheimera riviphila]RVU39902.1 ComF family protein [Rheinheimera riviphila]